MGSESGLVAATVALVHEAPCCHFHHVVAAAATVAFGHQEHVAEAMATMLCMLAVVVVMSCMPVVECLQRMAPNAAGRHLG